MVQMVVEVEVVEMEEMEEVERDRYMDYKVDMDTYIVDSLNIMVIVIVICFLVLFHHDFSSLLYGGY
eukprot:jgi/Orpsp1_1/1192661/evm.model.d7180000095056.1